MTTARREQAKALFTELKTVLREIQETEAADLLQDAPGGTGLPALLGSLHALRDLCSARALLYARVAASSAGKKHSGVPRRKAAPDPAAATGPRRERRV